jgi:UDP-N-acetylglucosamine 1-carboxyvinyltransferase
MDKIIIQGKQKLLGEVKISGSKNAALPIISATLLAPGKYTLSNIPNLKDIDSILLLLKETGAEFTFKNNMIFIDTTGCNNFEATYDVVRKMRASVLIMGAGLSRHGSVKVSLPGGCAIGLRPINIHLKGLEALGAKIIMDKGYIILKSKKLIGSKIFLDFPSVGATENLMMAAACATGTTLLENVAKEPEIIDLANFLNSMGAKVFNAGTDKIIIEGVKELHPANYKIISDRIEAGTYIIAGLITNGEVSIKNIDPTYLDAFLEKLSEAKCNIKTGKKYIKAMHNGIIKSVNINTMPYPGFPTDLQAQFMALMTIAEGTSIIAENVFENRFMHVAELCRMNADIKIDGHTAIVKGVKSLIGAPVMATDLRASAALILAGLAAKGQTEVKRIYHLDRGYENLEKKLQKINANIKRVS